MMMRSTEKDILIKAQLCKLACDTSNARATGFVYPREGYIQVGDSPANARVNRTNTFNNTFSLALRTETVQPALRQTKPDIILCGIQYA